MVLILFIMFVVNVGGLFVILRLRLRICIFCLICCRLLSRLLRSYLWCSGRWAWMLFVGLVIRRIRRGRL